MKKILFLLLCATFLAGCTGNTVAEVTANAEPVQTHTPAPEQTRLPEAPEYTTRFGSAAEILLSDSGITVNGGAETDTVFLTRDIIYYEDRDSYDSGNPYGEGKEADRHTAEEAAAHAVVNITAPGAYRVTGQLSAGQIRIDLGEDAREDPDAVVELILSDADITCTVAPAILFLNTYECDADWSEEDARPDVDTADAGANLILEGENTVSGSYVARIFKDKDEEKKLWKQDGAIYSYMSMNVFGPGSLDLTAVNEGLDTELHLTIHGGSIRIFSGNDGINTNEDGVSVTTINGGNLTIFAGLGAEGDGIDSNGYLVINGGTVVSSAHPASDAGLDSDLGSFIHGGSVTALGSAMDWAESDSGQVTMNLRFAAQQKAGSTISITREDGTEVCSFTLEGEHARSYSGLILSRPEFVQGETYLVYADGVQMAYTGTDVLRGPGGRGPGPGGMEPPEGFDPENLPEGFDPGHLPEDFDPAGRGDRGPRPEAMEPPAMPEGERPPLPPDGFGGRQDDPVQGEPRTDFYMNDMVNFFSGVTAA